MTLPREVLPGSDYMITRRCSERRFFLRPDVETNNAFIYCLALAAQRANVQITFTCAMSNHHHTGIHDPEGNFPIFTEHFHGLLARCQNAHLGRFENFWSSEPTSVVRLVEATDVLDKMVYAFSNPAAADLVDNIDEWPGVSSFHATVATESISAVRPKYFFRDDGSMPDTVALPIARPRGFTNLTKVEWAELVTQRVRSQEADHRQRRSAAGIRVIGPAAVLAQDPFGCPQSYVSRFGRSPRVAAKSKWARIEALLRNRGFIERYRAAFMAHVSGAAAVLFPFGTYWMRRFGRVVCEEPDCKQAARFEACPSPGW